MNFIDSSGEEKVFSITDSTALPIEKPQDVVSTPISTTSTPISTTEDKSQNKITNIDDPNYKITKEEALELKQTEKEYKEALAFVKDMIAPAMMRIDATKLQIGDTYIRTVFTYAYPDILE